MDKMNVEILEDGTIKIETDKVSKINHTTAEALLRGIAKICGGKQVRKYKKGIVSSLQHKLQHALNKDHSH